MFNLYLFWGHILLGLFKREAPWRRFAFGSWKRLGARDDFSILLMEILQHLGHGWNLWMLGQKNIFSQSCKVNMAYLPSCFLLPWQLLGSIYWLAPPFKSFITSSENLRKLARNLRQGPYPRVNWFIFPPTKNDHLGRIPQLRAAPSPLHLFSRI